MIDRKRNLWIALSAALIAGLLVYGVYVLQLKQIEWQQTVPVVVPRDFIPAGAMLSADMLEYRMILKGAFEPGMVTDVHQVAGTETYVPLGTGEPILDWKIDRLRLMPKQGQSTFQIPKAYILSVSSGVRAGDRVRIYVSSPEGSRRLIPGDVVVASVKTANNLEIDNPKSPNLTSALQGDREKMYSSRREANGTIDQLNLNLSEEEWLLIDSACSGDKAKLIIALTPLSVPDI